MPAEVLVIGAGPAGIAAATAAAEHGRNVVVLDDNLEAGGQIWREPTAPPKAKKSDAAKARALNRLRRSGASVLPGRRVVAVKAEGRVTAVWERGVEASVEEFAFEQLVIATGARERFLPFHGWTLPGVFGAGGLQALVRGGLPVEGKRVMVAGTGPLLLAVAAHLAEAGSRIVAVVEQAPASSFARFGVSLWTQPSKLWQGALYRRTLWRTAFHRGCWVEEALPDASTQQLRAVRVTDGTQRWEIECDLLACGYHLVANTETAALLGCAFRDGLVTVDDEQRTSLPNVFCAGEPTGIAGLDAALAEGEVAGLVCAGQDATKAKRRVAAEKMFGQRLTAAFALRDELRALPREDTIVCRCEDVRLGTLRLQRGWTDAKLQARCGMGPCQGRICGPAVEFLLGWQPVSVREPLFPVPMKVFGSQRRDKESA